MTNTSMTDHETERRIPDAAETAEGMAFRVVEIAYKLAELGVKPGTLQIGNGYLWGIPVAPAADDMVSINVHTAADFELIEQSFGLSREQDPATEGNVYASGVVNGVAVQVYTGWKHFASGATS